MLLQYENYPFTSILGWSISRYELFDKCKRQYFYNYYPKYVPSVPGYKMTQLRNLTSIPLEIGNVVHDVLEAFLKRLQKSDSDIDEKRFFEFARNRADEYISGKTFIEMYYKFTDTLDKDKVYTKVTSCLENFIGSPAYSWIFMNAITNRDNWMIEPSGYGETRLEGLKAYCKMDFLLPVGEEIHILDWKTGSNDPIKHAAQLIGYAAAASQNFGIPWDRIFPKIVYLFPAYDELELQLSKVDFANFYENIRNQSNEMYAYCKDINGNVPNAMETFEMTPSPQLCRQCKFQELCFPDRKNVRVGENQNAEVCG